MVYRNVMIIFAVGGYKMLPPQGMLAADFWRQRSGPQLVLETQYTLLQILNLLFVVLIVDGLIIAMVPR